VRISQWIIVLMLAFGALGATSDATPTVTKRVLFLHSFGRDFSPYDATVTAIRQQLMEESGESIAIFDATLGADQAGGADDEQPFIEFLRHRFAAWPPDVVITIAPPAADFYLRNRDQVFPGTPVVVAALDQRLVPRPLLRAGDAAVASQHDLPALVDNILRVLPETQRIVVVLGDSPLERYWYGEFRREFAPFESRVSFEWLNEMTFGQMRKRLAVLPAHTAVLYTLLVTDAGGVTRERLAALEGLVEVSTAPIFSVYENEFGHGVVGGPFQSQQRRGAITAAAALHALSHQNATAPDIQIVGYDAPIYDGRELKRWGIDPARLPAGSEIRFRPPSLWDEHGFLVVTAASILVLQTALLIGLVRQRTRRRRAETEALTLSGMLITAHEDERRWLARELHDDITQRLAGLAIDAAKPPAGELCPLDIETRRSIRGGLVQLSEDVHNLSYRLHPSVLNDLGLVEALKAECDRVARAESLRVDVHADRLTQSPPKEVALGIYRAAQEALRNIARHAKASIVHLSLASQDGGLLLSVKDNGSGFDRDRPIRRPSLGHASMRERIRLLGGTLDIQSTLGEGTTIVAWVPIPKAAA
jgi:signal transduction histidine kinase